MSSNTNNKKIARYLIIGMCLCLVFAAGAMYMLAKEPNKKIEASTTEPTEEQTPEIEEEEPLEEEVTEDEAVAVEEEVTPAPEVQTIDVQVSEKLASMTLEEKVGQMFIVAPEVFSESSAVTEMDELSKKKMTKYNIGGLIMFSQNIIDPKQITSLNSELENYDTNGLPLFISVDEEGGLVSRISGNEEFPEAEFEDMSTVVDANRALEIGETIGSYLNKYNFNLDFAPDTDVLMNSKNTVVKDRSFGSDPAVVSQLSTNVVTGLHNNGILATAKHFPGHGNTVEDTHEGFAASYATLEEMKTTELVPFQTMIQNNIDFMMISHVVYPNVTENELPATMNYDIVTKLLKEEMGYNGIIITDAMNMGAIADNYSVAKSTVNAVKAGVDIVLMPSDFYKAYNAIIDAVGNGEIEESRIDESVRKILTLKMGKL